VTPEPREPSLLLLALWWGVLAWAGEHLWLMYLRFVRHRPETWLIEYVWLGLIAYLMVFACAGSVLRLLAGTQRTRRVAEGGLAGLGALCFLLVFGSLAKAAALLLAVGFAVRIATLSDWMKHFQYRIVRSTWPALGAGAVLVFVVTAAWHPLQERITLWRLPTAAASAPNVVLLVLDTVRASELSAYGFKRPTTPAFEAFGRGGVRFDRAMSTAPWTLAAHLSMFSGVFPHKMARPRIEANPSRVLEPSQPVLAQVLANHGYATGGFSANLSYATREWGFGRGFAHYEDYPISLGGFVQSTAIGRAIGLNEQWRRWLHYDEVLVRKNAKTISANLLSWISKHQDRPFFVFANYFDAHTVLVPPEPFRSLFVQTPSHMRYTYLPFSTRLVTEKPDDPKEYQAQRELYDGTIASVDHEIGLMLQEMGRRGLLNNTVVIITSDHGEMFGEHGRIGHGYVLFQTLLHVPLFIAWRGHIPEGSVITEPVTLADLPATILDLAGIDRGGIPGTSLERFWTPGDDSGQRTPVVSEDPRWLPRDAAGESQSIVVGHYQLIRHRCCAAPDWGRQKPQPEELYDIDADPNQLHNLASSPTFFAVRDELSAALDSALGGSR
jgi:arylsulfatase A-like enzyme